MQLSLLTPVLTETDFYRNDPQCVSGADATEVRIHSLGERVFERVYMSVTDGVVERHPSSVPVQNHPDPLQLVLKSERKQHLIGQTVSILPFIVSDMPQVRPRQALPVGVRGFGNDSDGPGRAVAHLHVPAVRPRVIAHGAQDAGVVVEPFRVGWDF